MPNTFVHVGMTDELRESTRAFMSAHVPELEANSFVDPKYYAGGRVKRGLRNSDGTGVLVGITKSGNVQGYTLGDDGEKIPQEGHLFYRGIDINDLINGFIHEDRLGYEETAYLLLFGDLPTREQLAHFSSLTNAWSELPENFTADMILKAPSPDVMNKLARSILAMYSYDPEPEARGMEAELFKSLCLIARTPMIVAHAYAVKRHYYDREGLYLHRAQPGMSIAENFLYSIRRDNSFTKEEAALLDLCLVLHAEHGGGNNSAFVCRAISSTGTDIYSAIAAAVGSLKGPKHGGANIAVTNMFKHIREDVKDWKDEDEIKNELRRILRGDAGDGSGLIYGMGHAVYTLSDPRAILLKRFARTVAEMKGRLDELQLIEDVERLSPRVFFSETESDKVICANVDMYSGFVYDMLGIPEELFTPLFATARMVGWCAHRIEEITNPMGRIMRPAYRSVQKKRAYTPLAERE